MNFMIVRSLSPYNGIIRRLGIREIQVVPSTAYGMLKFPVDIGIVIIRSIILIPTESATVTTSSKEILKEAEVRHENFKSSDMTGVPRSVAEHQLNIQEGYSPVRQKKRGQAQECAKAIQAENADATYQRLVDKAFDNLVGQNIEVYVDDLVIKSHTEIEMLRDMDETFRTLRKINMKLNPKKFGGKKSDLHWTPEVEQAFKQLKQHLSELPMLVAPKPKEELIVYLSASHGAISAVLMTERGMVQTPVYFVSRALQGLKLNYTPMEKLVLLLVFAAKRLRRYFQAHPIVVITDQPIKQIISRPDVAGRL
ncbi:reverse transcriptase domain-containing protein [Tanacetum coccineum]